MALSKPAVQNNGNAVHTRDVCVAAEQLRLGLERGDVRRLAVHHALGRRGRARAVDDHGVVVGPTAPGGSRPA